jgi:hypothetical protein
MSCSFLLSFCAWHSHLSCALANGDACAFDLDGITQHYSQQEKVGTVLRSRAPVEMRGQREFTEFVLNGESRVQSPTTPTPITTRGEPTPTTTRGNDEEEDPLTVEHQQTPMAVRFNLDASVHGDVEGGCDDTSASASRATTIYRKMPPAALAAMPKARTPLFRLTKLTPKERRVNHRKLREYLQRNVCFPAAHRRLIWRFLLKLPENQVRQHNPKRMRVPA